MAKEKFERTKPHVNTGSGCLMVPLGIAVGVLGVIAVLLAAPASLLQDGVASFDQVRGVVGGTSFGGASDFGVGYDPTCPQGAPFRCDEGACVLTPSMCDPEDQCPPDMPFLCVDGTCSNVPNNCVPHPECPGVTPYQCPAGGCVPAPADCGTSLPETAGCPAGSFMCPNGMCVVERSFCPGPDGLDETALPDLVSDSDPDLLDDLQAYANDNGIGAAGLIDLDCHVPGSGTACSAGHLCCCWIDVYNPTTGNDENVARICGYLPPSGPPPPPPAVCPEGWFQCADGSCVVTEAECVVPDVSAPDASGCSADAPVLCSDGTCVLTPSDCAPPPAEEPPAGDTGGDDSDDGDTGCPAGQFQCDDGSCVQTPSACEPSPPGGPGGPGDLTG